MASNNIDLSIVVPVFNEEMIIDELVKRMTAAAKSITDKYEIIFVNDGSRDKTQEKLKQACGIDPEKLHYISFARNFGHQIAITAGMDYAKGDAIVTIDGDLQDPPELIPEMYREYKNGFKVVYAKRSKRKGETFFKLFTAKMFYRLMARLVSFEIPLDVGDFRLIGRDVLDYLKQMKEYDKYIRGQIAWLGFKSTYVMFERDERKYGKTNYPFRKMLRLAFNGITAFSDSPLKLAAQLGFVVCIISFLIGVYALYGYYFNRNTVPGWASTIISVTFLGGVQLLSLGIIGEYISRIINNVRNRPLYVIDENTAEEKKD
ncbi:MAG: glycosyltransferase [Bacteroidetes bacterium 43-93]|uniref:glycosyltransferase family 2 protein n=1 Tax=uncultured Dysgonomonas sp. TaxID=206096 RepID=UPI000926A01F|nr:glycosyltransferase family 2 protein [uncultured Dysgonomonas sp.]MBN9483088.1 glycosyltransferase family 2 protein [Bacteroidota bacterium]OJW96346.1 MAG: glycosyltransferase [Bacteroidetes bacterium 43-93]